MFGREGVRPVRIERKATNTRDDCRAAKRPGGATDGVRLNRQHVIVRVTVVGENIPGARGILRHLQQVVRHGRRAVWIDERIEGRIDGVAAGAVIVSRREVGRVHHERIGRFIGVASANHPVVTRRIEVHALNRAAGFEQPADDTVDTVLRAADGKGQVA